MAPLIYLDTHVVVWLYAGQLQRIPASVQDVLNDQPLLISPMVLLEIQYLSEIGRFTDSVDQVVDVLTRDLGLAICDLPFPASARKALELSWTRDPFDRLIVGQAALRDLPLVTSDRQIRTHYSRALWHGAPDAVNNSLG